MYAHVWPAIHAETDGSLKLSVSLGIKILATEIFKTFRSLNPIYMNEIFQTNPLITCNLRSKNNLVTHRYNYGTYGKAVLKYLDPQYGIIYPMNTKQQKIFKHSEVF